MNRRSALWLGGGLALGCLTGCATAGYAGPARALRIAAGERGGLYLEFAQLLAEQLGQAEPLLTGRAVPTNGSVENLDLLAAGKADLALTLLDVATAAVGGQDPFRTPRPIRAIGRVYENYAQLVVLDAGPFRDFGQLRGKRVSWGAEGSGAAVLGDRLRRTAHLSTVVVHEPLSDAIDALAAGDLEALLWSGGIPTPALTALNEEDPIRLLPLEKQLPPLSRVYRGMYEPAGVPGNGYGRDGATTTIGVPDLLVCDRGLADDVVDAITRVLVQRAAQLVPEQVVGTQYLAERALIATGEVPLHPAAAAAYRDLRG